MPLTGNEKSAWEHKWLVRQSVMNSAADERKSIAVSKSREPLGRKLSRCEALASTEIRETCLEQNASDISSVESCFEMQEVGQQVDCFKTLAKSKGLPEKFLSCNFDGWDASQRAECQEFKVRVGVTKSFGHRSS